MRRKVISKFNVPKSGDYEICGPLGKNSRYEKIEEEPKLLPTEAYQASLIRYIRVSKGYSVEEFARKIKIDKSKISRVENYKALLSNHEFMKFLRLFNI